MLEVRPEKENLTLPFFGAALGSFARCYSFAKSDILANAGKVRQTAAVDGWTQSDRYTLLLFVTLISLILVSQEFA